MTLAEFHERVCELPLAQVRKKGALPLCCCVLTSWREASEPSVQGGLRPPSSPARSHLAQAVFVLKL